MSAEIRALRDAWDQAEYRPLFIVGGCLLVAILFAFARGLEDLWARWGQNQELSHSYFLPVVTAWMLWERRAAIAASVGAPNPIGFAVAAFAGFLLFLGTITHINVLIHLGFVSLLVILPLLYGGWSLQRVMVIPLLYLFFMVPPPYWVIYQLSSGFQLMSSALGVAMVRMMDIPVFLSGNVIELPTMTLQVVEACSGLRYLFPFLCLGALAAYFYVGPLWHRAIIVASTIPITIAMNSFRIALTAVLIEKVGGNHTDGFLHFFEGWVVFLLCIGFLILVIWGLTLTRGEKAPFVFLGFEDVAPVAPTGVWDGKAAARHGMILTVGLLVMGAIVHTAASRQLIVPERQDLDFLTSEFAGWDARQSTLDVEVATALGADDYIIADMYGPEEQSINLYIAWLDAQRDGRSWHSPLQCLPGGGWEIRARDFQSVEGTDGTPYTHNRMVIAQGESKLLVYYWYEQRGRRIANEFTVKFLVMWDALVRRRSDGAMIRLMTPIKAGETMADAEARLDTMRRELLPKLPAYVPA